MKNLFLATALAALALSSCDKLAPEAPATDDLAIRFSTSTIEPATSRATPVTGISFADGSSIGVYATKTIESTTVPFMEDKQVTRASGAWTYSPLAYFVKGYTYSFVGYAPYGAATELTATTVKYAADADITKQADFMYASAVERAYTTDTAPAAIDFTFKHALAQVKFSAKTTQDYSSYCTAEVTGIKIAGLASEGTLTFADGTWVLTAGKTADYSQAVNSVTLGTSFAPLANVDGHVLMLLPQTLTDIEAVITVKITSTPPNSVVDGTKEITVTIPNVTWAANNIYNYQATLDLDQILGLSQGSFADPIITPWGTQTDIPVTQK